MGSLGFLVLQLLLSSFVSLGGMVNHLRVYGSVALVVGYVLIAGSPFKALGIAVRISGHLTRLPYSFRYRLRDFIGFHGFFFVVEILLLWQALKK